jgi:hypothetical protein
MNKLGPGSIGVNALSGPEVVPARRCRSESNPRIHRAGPQPNDSEPRFGRNLQFHSGPARHVTSRSTLGGNWGEQFIYPKPEGIAASAAPAVPKPLQLRPSGLPQVQLGVYSRCAGAAPLRFTVQVRRKDSSDD